MIRFITKVWTSFKEYIVLVILILVSLIILSQNQNPNVQNLRAIAFGSFASVTSILSDFFSVTNLNRENEELRETNAKLMMQISKLRSYGIINNELKGLLSLKDTTGLPLIPATIISRSLSMTQSTITLNAGVSDSVLPGMPVINDRGLIGIIHTTSDNYSIARTLNNVDFKLTVMDERSRVNGILKWTGEEHIIINIPFTFDIEVGDRIITSEISSIVPVQIPVGIVEEFRAGEAGVFSYIKVKPFVDLNPIENVFIVSLVRSKQIDSLELNFYKRQ
jgi:rod shape-determining protein MreC